MTPRALDGPQLRREARIVGLDEIELPTLEAVEKRRFQLLLVMSIVAVAVALGLAALTMWDHEGTATWWLSPALTRFAVLGLVVGFCAYAIEKELHLRRLTRQLVEERVIVSALASRLKELSALLEAGRAMNSVLDLEQVLRIILDSAVELLDARGGSVMLLETPQHLRVVCVKGNEGAEGARVEVGDGIAGRVAVTREPLLINGVVGAGEYPGRRERAQPVDSAMSIPLIHRGELVGVLNVNAADRVFSEHDLRALALVGEHAACAVANARLYEAERCHAVELEHQAFHDPLTGLANRALFTDRVQHALVRAGRDASAVGVLFCDLDDFKRINDSLGHAAGDQLLVAVGQRLQGAVRAVDTPARLGGDEFAVLLEDIRDVGEARRAADRVLESLAAPFVLDGRPVSVRASIGVASSGPEATTADELMRNADVAMYTAKAQGKGCHRTFERDMHAEVLARLELESELEAAVARGELCLHYQPILSLESGRVVGVEALVRWNHPTRGLLYPGAFVPLAEELGLIGAIDTWVLERACRQTRAWHERHPDRPPLSVNVNVSARQLQTGAVVDAVAGALRRSGLDPHSLVVELTESSVVHDPATTSRWLQALRDLGVRLAIDDFGTGYSSLAYLKRLPIDILKIDRAFVAGLGVEPEDAALVSTIVELARSLRLEVVAEGIERAEQLDELRHLGCDLGQGFHFAAGLEPERLAAILADEDGHPLTDAVATTLF